MYTWVGLLSICAMQEPESFSRYLTTCAYIYVPDGILQVDAYEQGRPGYPLSAVNYALKEAGLNTGCKKIVDLAAGTGKLTRSASIAVICHPVLVLCHDGHAKRWQQYRRVMQQQCAFLL